MSEEGNAKEDLTRFERQPGVTFYNSLESYPTCISTCSCTHTYEVLVSYCTASYNKLLCVPYRVSLGVTSRLRLCCSHMTVT